MPAPIRHRVLRGSWLQHNVSALDAFSVRNLPIGRLRLFVGAYYTSANEFCFRARCKSSLAVTRSACLRHASGGLEVRDPVRCRQLHTQG